MAAKKGNKYAKGCETSGRPAIFTSPLELQSKIDKYFDGGARARKIITALGDVVEVPAITICGLAYYLGFSSRQSLLDYEKRDEFSDIIKKARLRVEMNYEEMLCDGKPTGAIFALKNMGWYDRQELTGKDGSDLIPARALSKEEAKEFLKELNEKC